MDRRLRAVWRHWGLAAVVAVTGLGAIGCRSGPSSIAPMGLGAVESSVVEEWVAQFAPRQSRLYEVRPWRFRNERGAAAGRAALRIVPPDSLRFDYRGPFGRSGAAVVIGDSALWVRPEAEFRGLVSMAALFWASLGMPLMPPDKVQLYALEQEDLRAWRYVVDGDTLNFVVRGTPATRLLAEVRREGHTIGVTEVELDPATGLTRESRIDFPLDVSRFSFTVRSIDTLAIFEPTIWLQP